MAAIFYGGLSASIVVMAEETQQQLQSMAKITESAARATATARVPHAVVQSSELEREKGKLVWSYDLTMPKSKNITEVQIDAITGKVVSIIVETPKCQVSCDTIQQRVWRLSAARTALTQLYQHLGA